MKTNKEANEEAIKELEEILERLDLIELKINAMRHIAVEVKEDVQKEQVRK